MADKFTTEDRIAHFLRLAEDSGATQHERDVAAEQAERLMLKHGIDRAAAMAADSNVQRDEPIVKETIFFGGLYAKERMEGTVALARAFGLQAYYANTWGVDGNNSHANRQVQGMRVTIVGFESDAQDVMRIIRSVDVQCAVAVKAWAKTQKDAWYWYSAADKTVARRTFILAFGNGAAARVRLSRKEAVQEAGEGTALVLVNREAKVKEFYANINLRSSRSRGRRMDGSGWSAGHAAGYNANTGSGPAIKGTRAIGR